MRAQGGESKAATSPPEMFLIAAAIVDSNFMLQHYRVGARVDTARVVTKRLLRKRDQWRVFCNPMPLIRIWTRSKLWPHLVKLLVVHGDDSDVNIAMSKTNHRIRLVFESCWRHDQTDSFLMFLVRPVTEICSFNASDLATLVTLMCFIPPPNPRDSNIRVACTIPQEVVVRVPNLAPLAAPWNLHSEPIWPAPIHTICRSGCLEHIWTLRLHQHFGSAGMAINLLCRC